MLKCIGYIASSARVTASDEPGVGGGGGGGAWKVAVLTYFTEGTDFRKSVYLGSALRLEHTPLEY